MQITHLAVYFLITLLAMLTPSPLPIPLDGIVIASITSGFNPLLVITLTIIGYIIGTWFFYIIGLKGRTLIDSYSKGKNYRVQTLAENFFLKYGKYSLLLSGVPFLGDSLVLVAGFFKINTKTFFIYFILGKIIWYGLFVTLLSFTKWSIF